MNTNDRQTWEKLKEVEQSSVQDLFSRWNQMEDKEAVLRAALARPHERGSALRLLLLLNDQELLSRLFPTLIDLASVGQSDIALCRAVIKTMHREWLLAHIEQEVNALLNRGSDEEYRRIAELYAEVDASLLEKLVARALAHSDPNIREVGQDFQVCPAHSYHGNGSP